MLMLAQGDSDYAQVILPKYFVPIFFALMVAGLLGCLIAAVLGFRRARDHGGNGRWFALAAVCLVIYHVQLLVMGFAAMKANASIAFPLITLLNLFIFLAAVCIIFGFYKMRPAIPETKVADPD
jgi:uncharacterized membrane protein YhaH (DUF805 family)